MDEHAHAGGVSTSHASRRGSQILDRSGASCAAQALPTIRAVYLRGDAVEWIQRVPGGRSFPKSRFGRTNCAPHSGFDVLSWKMDRFKRRDSPMNVNFTAVVAAALAAIVLLSGCGTNADGQPRTLAECWKANAERQDAAARNFVRTD